MATRKRRDVYVTDAFWDALSDLVNVVHDPPVTQTCMDDVLELALRELFKLDHPQILKRLRRFKRPAPKPQPIEATAASASS